jgi:hypothetical protein
MQSKESDKSISKEDYSNFVSENLVSKFMMIYPMLVLSRDEMRTFYANNKDSVSNKLKVKMINKLINSAREFLVKEPILEYLEQLDEDMLPQNSDIVLILCQYIEALDQFKRKNQVYAGAGIYKWRTQENPNPSMEN